MLINLNKILKYLEGWMNNIDLIEIKENNPKESNRIIEVKKIFLKKIF